MYLLLAAVLAASPSGAATLTVCASGCDHTDVQAAIDAGADGDVIQAAPGSYTLEPQNLATPVTIQQTPGAEGTLELVLPDAGIGVYTDVVIEGARLRGEGNEGSSSLLALWAGSLKLTDCVIEDQTFRDAVIMTEEGSLSLQRCTLSGNSTGDGVILDTGADITVYDTTFSNNVSDSGAAVLTLHGSTGETKLKRSTVTGNSGAYGAIRLRSSSAVLKLNQTTITGNAATTKQAGGIDNSGGGSVYVWNGSTVTGNSTHDEVAATDDPGFPNCVGQGDACPTN